MKQQPDQQPNTFDPYELEWGRRYLHYLRRSAYDNSVRNWTLITALALGLVLTVLGDQITVGVIPLPAGWRVDFVGGILYELGLILWTSVVVVFLLEIFVEQQQRRNRDYLRQLEAQLGESVTPDEPAADEETLAHQIESLNARLDAILAELDRLKTLDELRGEVASLKAALKS